MAAGRDAVRRGDMCGRELMVGAVCAMLGGGLVLGGLAAAAVHIMRRVVGG